MKKLITKPSRNYDYFILLAIVILTFVIRFYGQLDKVFVDGQVVFREVDPYLHMRLAENIAANYPHILQWDMYSLYPGGAAPYPPVLAFIIATIAWIIGLGHPTLYLVDTVGAWTPPVIAFLVVIVVYFMVKEVFKNRFVALFSALLVGILPTELFHRSLLGFTDHHILEVLLALSTITLIIYAVNRRNIFFGLGAVVSFMLYYFNWIGWPLLLAIIVAWAYFYFGIKFLKKRWPLIGFPVLILIGLTLAVPGLKSMAFAFLSHTFLGAFGTIQEGAPMDLKTYWYIYGLSGILMAGGMFLAIKHKYNSLFLTWAIFFIIASLMERRWGYYSTIGVAIFAAYFIYWIGTKVTKSWKYYAVGYVSLVTIFTTVQYTAYLASKPNDITSDWYNACLWLNAYTPEPYNSDYYYSLKADKASYGVLSWWDYGHWIIKIGHRVPITSPTQQESPAYYPFFVKTTEAEANQAIQGSGIRYLILDNMLLGPKYHAVCSKVFESSDNWPNVLLNSFVYKLYQGASSDTWKLIHTEGNIKIYEWEG